MNDVSPLPLSPQVYEAVQSAAKADGLSVSAYLAKLVTEHFQQNKKRRKTITLTATLNRKLYAQVHKFAKRQRISITDLVRPWLLAALEKDDFPPSDPGIATGGMSLAIRIPVNLRRQLGEIAEARGTNVSMMLAAVIADKMKYETGAAA